MAIERAPDEIVATPPGPGRELPDWLATLMGPVPQDVDQGSAPRDPLDHAFADLSADEMAALVAGRWPHPRRLDVHYSRARPVALAACYVALAALVLLPRRDSPRAVVAEPEIAAAVHGVPQALAIDAPAGFDFERLPALTAPPSEPSQSAPPGEIYTASRRGRPALSWDLLLRADDGTLWNEVTGPRGERDGGAYHDAIDVGAPRGSTIVFAGYVPWETATVARVMTHAEACAPWSPRNFCNAGSIVDIQSIIGRLRVTRRIFHAQLAVTAGQVLHPGDEIGRVWDYGRTRHLDGSPGRAPHVHYEIWLASTSDDECELGENVPLSRLERRLQAELEGTTRSDRMPAARVGRRQPLTTIAHSGAGGSGMHFEPPARLAAR